MPDARRGEDAPTPARHVGYDALDGRLDLDALDVDVVDAGPAGPPPSERLRRLLARSRTAALVRRHRVAATALALAAALVLVVIGSWWAARPEPLPATPLVLVTTSGPDSQQVDVSPSDGGLVGLTLQVTVASAEHAGVAVTLVALTGPALEPPRDPAGTASTDPVTTVSATLDCATPSTSAAGLAAVPSDFGVEVRRAGPDGEVRVDTVPLVGAQRLAQVVRQTCLQATAGRELVVSAVDAAPLSHVAAAEVDVTVRDSGTRRWPGLRVSVLGLPWVVNGLPAADLAPGATATVRARLWVQDCADPAAALADGLPLQAAFAGADAVDDAGNTFRLPLDGAQRDRVARAFAGVCSSPTPTATVTRAVLRTGGTATSAGTVDLTIVVRAVAADLLEVGAGGPEPGGLLSPLDSPVRLVDGAGVLHAVWTLPACADLPTTGPPELAVALVNLDSSGGERRPYVVALGGDALQVELRRACGAAGATPAP